MQVIIGVDANGVFSTKSIEDLQVGDTVIARDQHDSADDLDPRRVTSILRKISDHVRTLTIAGDGGMTESLRTTNKHPFFALDRGWLAAGKLLPGDRLRQPDGSWQEVLDSEREGRRGMSLTHDWPPARTPLCQLVPDLWLLCIAR